jgi:hypothetical protein
MRCAIALGVEVRDMTPEQKLDAAREMVLHFCSSKRDSKDGPAHHSVTVLRNHFDTSAAQAHERQLNVSFPRLIDELIKSGQIRVTNGFVWVSR